MKDLIEARKVLGINENTTKDEVIKRYEMLLKKYKESEEVDGVKVEDINNAYNLIMGYDLSDKPEMQPSEPSFFSKLWAKLFKLDAKKVDNFFLYNKYTIIISIVGIILLFSIIKGVITRVDTDFYLTSIGQITIEDSEKVQENIKKITPSLQAPLAEALYIGQNDQGEQTYAMMMKISASLAAGEMDLILVDKDMYDSLAKQGAFETVDDLSKSIGFSLPKDEELFVKPEEGEGAVYGVDVTNSQFLKENGIKGKKIIATIRINAKHKDIALQFYKSIFETIKK